MGLVDDGLEVTDDVRDLGSEGRVEGDSRSTLDLGRDGEVSERDALVDEESAGSKMRVEGLEGTDLTLCKTGVDRLRIGSDPANDKAVDHTSEGADLRIGKGDPLIDEGSFLGVRPEKVGVGGKGSNYRSNQRSVSKIRFSQSRSE